MRSLQTWKTCCRVCLGILLKGGVWAYRFSLAPLLGGQCRFYPSCSEFALQAIDAHPPAKALGLIGKRLLCCHPFHPGGVDQPLGGDKGPTS